MKLLKILSITALVVIGIAIVRMYPLLNLGQSYAITHDESCSIEEGLFGAEDITVDQERSLALLATDDRRSFLRTGEMSEVNGDLWSLDLSTPDSDPLKIQTDFHGVFHPHGISLFTDDQGKRFLFVVNHITTKEHAIEIFELVSPTSAKHISSIVVPEFSSPNDVHAIAVNQFFFTNDHMFSRDTLGEKIEDFLRLPTSNVYFFDGEKAIRIIDGLSMANGITATPDMRHLYVAESSGERISRFEQNAEGEWQTTKTITLNVMPDNLELDSHGRLLVGSHPKALDFLIHVFDEHAAAPSIAQRIDTNNDYAVETLYYDEGENLSGSSVAAVYENQLLVGTVFEPHIARCNLASR